MKYGSVIFCLNLAYVIGLFCFLILFYFKIKIIFLTNSLIIASIILLIIKLFLWYLIGKDQDNTNIANKQKIFLYRLSYCIFAYILPIYSIFQEPRLVVSHYVSTITFIIVTVLTTTAIIIGRNLFFNNFMRSSI